MLGRENLKIYDYNNGALDNYGSPYGLWPMYDKEEADKVMDDLESQVKNLKNANAELIKRVQELEDECNELEEANKRTQKHREEVESSESNIRQEMFKMESRIKELERTKNGILTRNVELIGENAQLKMKVRELEEAISKMETTTTTPTTEDSSAVEMEK